MNQLLLRFGLKGQEATRSTKKPQYLRAVALIIGSVVILTVALTPFYLMISVSIIPEQQLFGRAPQFLPRFGSITLDNYRALFEFLPFTKIFTNSVIVSTSTVILTLLVAVPAAYAFARFRFRFRTPMMTSLLLLYMIPPVVLLVPFLILFKQYGLLNSYQGLILAEFMLTSPFAIWLLISFFAALPRELEDAALVDGCTPLGALIRIVLPLALPGLVAAGLFVFISTWNHFLFAFVFTQGDDVKTLPVLMRSFVRGESGIFWGTIMSSAVLTTLPVALVFLFFQRYLIRGLATGAVKG
jgi:ABC-type glycerol-3-phosphate transport system permease component